ncbi:oligosaccharide repeat unit polymerase [Algibacillus agarilyticus]|uniref:oligosaccharide repeat unit polymerase n=1 Tax=Algibacillus agarilyticus TaxID=2234133 RepID=UPI000DD0EB8E|nr:oligosaccharide repeat unit polymerase [Algibacillus agarilyticus]
MFFISPFKSLIAVLCLAWSLSQFEFSSLYGKPSLELNVLLLLVIFVLIFSEFLYLYVSKCNRYISYFRANNVDDKIVHSKFPKFLFITTLFLFCCEVAVYGVPLFGGDYKDFGFPVVHVIMYSLCLYLVLEYSVVVRKNTIFSSYLVIGVVFLISILMLSRHLLMYGLFIMLLAYVIRRKLTFKLCLIAAISVSTLLILFGVLGTYRMSGLLNISYGEAEQYILEAGGASDHFISEGGSAVFYWFWLYVTSPISNLDFNIQHVNLNSEYDLNNFVRFFIFENLPQTISKRVAVVFDIAPRSNNLVAEHLNVSTAFSESYGYLGLLGVLLHTLMFAFYFFITFILCKRRESRVMSLVLYILVGLFMVFDNMLSYPATIFTTIFIIIRDGYFVSSTKGIKCI